MGRYGQAGKLMEGVATGNGMKALELVVPNPKLKLMDQVQEVMRLRHYAIRTEQA